MQEFSYRARNRQGEIYTGLITAEDKHMAATKIRQRGLWVVGLQTTAKANKASVDNFSLSKIKFSTSVSSSEQVAFFQQLKVLLSAGIPIHEALKILQSDNDHSNLQPIIKGVLQSLSQGNSLANALSTHNKTFSPLVITLIKAGEASGTLELVMEHLASYLAQMSEAKQKLQTALIYPAILLLTVILVAIIMTVVVLPTFAEMLTGLQVALPLPTRILLAIATFSHSYGILLAVILAVMMISGRYMLKMLAVKYKLACYWLKLPYLGNLVAELSWWQFFSTSAVLLKNGMLLANALPLSKETMTNFYLREQIDKVMQALKNGESFTKSLQKIATFPSIAGGLIKAGEQSGQLEEMLEQAATFCRLRVNDRLARLMALAEPLAITVVGGLIFLLVMAIVLPLLNMLDIVSN